MFELLLVVCAAASVSGTSCVPPASSAEQLPLPDSHEMRVAPGTYQLSYAGHGRHFTREALLAHWRQRAAQLCAGPYAGGPLAERRYPDPGYELMVSRLFLASSRSDSVEVYGVAHCADPAR